MLYYYCCYVMCNVGKVFSATPYTEIAFENSKRSTSGRVVVPAFTSNQLGPNLELN